MTIHWLDYAIIILYFFVVVYIGYWAMKKVTNFDDYAVAGRGLPMSIFFAAIAATMCGGGAFRSCTPRASWSSPGSSAW